MDVNNDQPEVDLDSVSILIPKSQQGDGVAREKLLGELQSYLEMVAQQNLQGGLKQKVGVSDVVQMSFVRVLENFENFRGNSRGEFHSWLKSIVINEINKTRRTYATKKRDVSRETPIDSPTTAFSAHPVDTNNTPCRENMAAERVEVFREVLKELSPQHAEVIQLRRIDELPFKEIAEKMGRSEDSVSKLWYRAMLKLEEKLKMRGNFESQ